MHSVLILHYPYSEPEPCICAPACMEYKGRFALHTILRLHLRRYSAFARIWCQLHSGLLRVDPRKISFSLIELGHLLTFLTCRIVVCWRFKTLRKFPNFFCITIRSISVVFTSLDNETTLVKSKFSSNIFLSRSSINSEDAICSGNIVSDSLWPVICRLRLHSLWDRSGIHSQSRHLKRLKPAAGRHGWLFSPHYVVHGLSGFGE